VHKHPDLSSALVHQHVLCCIFESSFLHQIEEQRRVLAAGVGEDGLAAGREKVGDEIREGPCAPPLVEHVGGEDAFEGIEALHLRRVPVEERGPRLQAKVRPGVVDREVEGGLVVVRRENIRAAREGDGAGKPDAATELDGAPAGQVFAREVSCQGDRARPELGPVREPLVACEISFVYEGVSRGGMEDAVGFFPDLDDGFEEAGAAAEVGSERVYRPTEAASRAARLSRSAAASWAML
jgi:hypothetical protein